MLTLFTQDFRKLLLAVAAVATGLVLYACIVAGMTSMSSRAEQKLDSFPFKDEDWLRYLLPSRFTETVTGKGRIMLAGPSTVRENLLYNEFEKAFPEFSIYQGGISLGTIDDVTASLEYIEKVYGSGALPNIVILGISPRFLGNIPDKRPFSLGLDLYSPFYAARHTDNGIVLEPKGHVDSLKARLNFLTSKQPERFRTTLQARLNNWLLEGNETDFDPDADTIRLTTRQELVNKLFKHPLSVSIIRNGQFKRALDFEFTQVLAWLISPYKYLLSEPMSATGLKGWLKDPDSWWTTVYNWNPEETQTSASIKRFTEFIKTHNMKLVIVNLPERDISREMFDAAHYQAYLDIAKASFGDVPFMNFREISSPDEFYDAEHTVYQGSLRLTKEVINKLKGIFDSQDKR